MADLRIRFWVMTRLLRFKRCPHKSFWTHPLFGEISAYETFNKPLQPLLLQVEDPWKKVEKGEADE